MLRELTMMAPSGRFRAAQALCSPMPPLVAQRMRNIIYPRSAAQAENFNFTVESVTGSPFTGTTSDLVAYPVAIHGYYNWRNIAIARAVCEEGDVILEIGANIGSETIGFSDIVGAGGVVYAFEPFPPNLERLQVNSEQTRFRNITVFPVALSDREADVRFVPPTPDNSGRGHLLGPPDRCMRSPSRDTLGVHCTTIDSLLPQMARAPQLVVVDAEGHEAAILRGAEEMLALHQPVVVLEVLGPLLARAGTSPQELARHLRSLDYSLFELTLLRVAPIDVADHNLPDTSDWVAVPASRSNLIKRIRHTIRRCGLMPCIPRFNPLRPT